jgi:hypothetical protein
LVPGGGFWAITMSFSFSGEIDFFIVTIKPSFSRILFASKYDLFLMSGTVIFLTSDFFAPLLRTIKIVVPFFVLALGAGFWEIIYPFLYSLLNSDLEAFSLKFVLAIIFLAPLKFNPLRLGTV